MSKQEYVREKEGSNISKIVIDSDLCIGCGTCVATSDTTYKLNDENKSTVIDANAADDETLKMSAQGCPSGAIVLFDKDGNQI
jgi:ferredoxin